MKKYLYCVSALTLILLAGCETWDRLYNDHAADFNDAAMIGTLLYIENDDGTIDFDKAQGLYAELLKAQASIKKAGQVTVDDVEGWILGNIDLNDMSLSRRLMFQKAWNRIQIQLREKAKDIDDAAGYVRQHTVAVNELIETVLDTLEPYQ